MQRCRPFPNRLNASRVACPCSLSSGTISIFAPAIKRSRSRRPSAPYRASITMDVSTKMATDIRRESAASIASRNRRRSLSVLRMATRAEVSITISWEAHLRHSREFHRQFCCRAREGWRNVWRFPLTHRLTAARIAPAVPERACPEEPWSPLPSWSRRFAWPTRRPAVPPRHCEYSKPLLTCRSSSTFITPSRYHRGSLPAESFDWIDP